jgi:hypothetical protein
VAWEVGQRAGAVLSLQKAAARARTDAAQALAEPFLCPSPRYEAFNPGDKTGEWLECMLVEQFEKLRAFSSLYTFNTSPAAAVLAPIAQCAFRSPEVDRRLQLTAMLSGQQEGPSASMLLARPSEENLNPEFWRGS